MQTISVENLDYQSLLRPSESLVIGQACAEPLTLVEALVTQRASLSNPQVFLGASFAGILQPAHADHLRFQSFGALGTNRQLARAGVLGLIPCHVARIGPYFTQGTLPCDVLLVQLGPQNADGTYGFGVTADYIRAAADKARVVIAEINDQAPRTSGHRGLREDEIDIAIHTSRPLPTVPAASPTPADIAIAHNAAAFINDEAVLQIGIGATPDAILRALAGHRDLGFHSGMMSDGVVDLINAGAITNAFKPVDPGVCVTGALIGTEKLYHFAHDNPAIALRDSGYTHGDQILCQLETLVTINSAIEVDLTGQVNAEQIGNDYLGGVGGQADFVRAGHRAAKGHAIIALPSSARGGISRIVPSLASGVSTSRTDIDVVVTEYGAAQLRGCTLAERAKRMIAVAHPDQREALSRAAHGLMRQGFPVSS